MKTKLVLASASPRRARLLSEAGIEFAVEPSDIEEIFDEGLTATENAAKVAVEKAESVAGPAPDALVLAADTVVVLDGEIIGKPADTAAARAMLARLAGREHEVITGVALVDATRELVWSGTASSRVRFREIPAEDIAAYVATGEPMDKAGAYAIQGGAAKWIEGYEGSLTNIIGLPMELLCETFDRFGYDFAKKGTTCRCSG